MSETGSVRRDTAPGGRARAPTPGVNVTPLPADQRWQTMLARGVDVDTFDDIETRLGSFRRDDRPHVPQLVVDGDIDDRLVEDFTDALFKTIIDAHGTAVLDLTGVTYLG